MGIPFICNTQKYTKYSHIYYYLLESEKQLLTIINNAVKIICIKPTNWANILMWQTGRNVGNKLKCYYQDDFRHSKLPNHYHNGWIHSPISPKKPPPIVPPKNRVDFMKEDWVEKRRIWGWFVSELGMKEKEWTVCV